MPKKLHPFFICVLLPFFIWIILFRHFIFGGLPAVHDTLGSYSIIKFYLNSIQTGAYPLWDPFTVWGTPSTIALRVIGELNPFLYLILFLNLLGMKFYYAFMFFLVFYYALGLGGFYLLGRRIFKNDFFASLATVLLMFSSLGMSLFNQINMLFIFVPSAWFFYFLVSLPEEWRLKDFVGLTFTLMLIFSTYIPFYFMTVILILGIVSGVMYLGQIKTPAAKALHFFKSKTIPVILCILALLIALIPTVQAFTSTLGSDSIAPERHESSGEALKQGVAMGYSEIARSSLLKGEVIYRIYPDARRLFSNFSEGTFTDDRIFYVSLFSLIVLLLSSLTLLTKRILLFSLSGFFLFLISIADATPVHPFLFKHIFYFKYFRNLYFFLPFIVALFVLLTVDLLRLFLKDKGKEGSPKRQQILFIGTVHGVFFLFIFFSKSHNIFAYLTVALSCIFFISYSLRFFSLKKYPAQLFLLALVLVHPAGMIPVFHAYAQHYQENIQKPEFNIAKQITARPTAKPTIFLQRPPRHSKDYESLSYLAKRYLIFDHRAALKDSPGFIIPKSGDPTRWTYQFNQNMNEDAYRDYLTYKFVVYDAVVTFEEGVKGYSDLSTALRTNRNRAFVASINPEDLKGKDAPKSENAMRIKNNSKEFSLISSTANTVKIKTNFNSKKFLVYNDSFHSYWHGFINGNEKPLYRANLAFKGIWVPAGETTVEFKYLPPGGTYLYFPALLTFIAILGYLAYLSCTERQNGRGEKIL